MRGPLLSWQRSFFPFWTNCRASNVCAVDTMNFRQGLRYDFVQQSVVCVSTMQYLSFFTRKLACIYRCSSDACTEFQRHFHGLKRHSRSSKNRSSICTDRLRHSVGMFRSPRPTSMPVKSSASKNAGRAEVNRLVQVQGYRFFAVKPPKDGC